VLPPTTRNCVLILSVILLWTNILLKGLLSLSPSAYLVPLSTSSSRCLLTAADWICDQRGASATLAPRSSLSARTTVQGNHTASSTHWNKPHHGWSGAPGGRKPEVLL
jgi:hypothetical protein